MDDVEHRSKADTSPHLVEQLTGSRDFLACTLEDVRCHMIVPADQPVSLSRNGVLDLAVGKYVDDKVKLRASCISSERLLPRAAPTQANTTRMLELILPAGAEYQ